jgi:hypothetical protein
LRIIKVQKSESETYLAFIEIAEQQVLKTKVQCCLGGDGTKSYTTHTWIYVSARGY